MKYLHICGVKVFFLCRRHWNEDKWLFRSLVNSLILFLLLIDFTRSHLMHDTNIFIIIFDSLACAPCVSRKQASVSFIKLWLHPRDTADGLVYPRSWFIALLSFRPSRLVIWTLPSFLLNCKVPTQLRSCEFPHSPILRTKAWEREREMQYLAATRITSHSSDSWWLLY